MHSVMLAPVVRKQKGEEWLLQLVKLVPWMVAVMAVVAVVAGVPEIPVLFALAVVAEACSPRETLHFHPAMLRAKATHL